MALPCEDHLTESRKMQYPSLLIKVLLLILCFSLSTACLTGGGTNSLSGTSSTIEPISETESNLYDNDGAINIPVTIAKLQSPLNVEKIVIELETSIPGGAPKGLSYLKDVKTPLTGYKITGAADCVDAGTAYVMIINTLTEQRLLQEVNSDGSFEALIPAIEGTSVMMLAVDETETYGSMPISASYEKSVTTFNLTASSESIINTRQQLLMDRFWVYFSLRADDSSFALVRRHLNGRLQVIADKLSTAPRHVSVTQSFNLAFVTQSGFVYFVPYREKSDGIQGSYDNRVLLYKIGESLNNSDDVNEPSSAKVSVTNNGVFLYTRPFLNDKSTVKQEYYVRFINRDTKEVTGLISRADFRSATWGDGRGNKRFLAVQARHVNPNMPYRLFEINLLDDEDAWDNRVFLSQHVEGAKISSIASSVSDHLVFVDIQFPIKRFYQYDEGYSPLKFLQQNINSRINILPWIVLDPISDVTDTKIATCIIDTEDSDNNELVYIEVSMGEKNDVLSLTNSDYNASCNGSYSMSSHGIVAFYQKILRNDNTYSPPQITIIDTSKIIPDEMDEVNVIVD
jgi:hypothetical protein